MLVAFVPWELRMPDMKMRQQGHLHHPEAWKCSRATPVENGAIVHKQSSLLYLTIPCLIQQAGTDKHIQGSETDKS